MVIKLGRRVDDRSPGTRMVRMANERADVDVDLIVEDFEAYDATTTLEDHYSADFGADFDNYDVSADAAFTGSQGLKSDGEVWGQAIVSQPGSGLDNYPEAGDTFEVYVRSDTNTSESVSALIFGRQSGGASYFLYFRWDDDQVELADWDGSNLNSLDTNALTLPENTWFRAEVDWATNGDINVTVEDDDGPASASLFDNDTSYTLGGIGWWYDTSGTHYFDDLKITDRD